jgi:ubiquitin C-terminal hydrolase
VAPHQSAYEPLETRSSETERIAAQVLVLHLKRFRWSATGLRSKLTTTVTCPAHHLDVSRYQSAMCKAHPHTYHLYGVTNHVGVMGGGHYTATCLNPGDQQWYHFNDQLVLKARPPVATPSAYILFYCMAEDPANPQCPQD